MNRPDKYVYPAVLTYEEGYDIAVTFPDLPGCATSGTDEADAIKMAREALGGHLWCMENDNDEIPAASSVRSLEIEENEVIILVEVYMPSIRLAHESRAVTRTVTLPAWMNAKAAEAGINFSQALQQTLINQYHITQ